MEAVTLSWASVLMGEHKGGWVFRAEGLDRAKAAGLEGRRGELIRHSRLQPAAGGGGDLFLLPSDHWGSVRDGEFAARPGTGCPGFLPTH